MEILRGKTLRTIKCLEGVRQAQETKWEGICILITGYGYTRGSDQDYSKVNCNRHKILLDIFLSEGIFGSFLGTLFSLEAL